MITHINRALDRWLEMVWANGVWGWIILIALYAVIIAEAAWLVSK